jgi:serine/threonine protein kinase
VAKNNQSADSGTIPHRHTTLPIEFIFQDQRRRWAAGECILLETYFEKNPLWHFSSKEQLDLIYHEILLREGRGEHPALEEYARRFPLLLDELRLHFEIHDALSSLDEPTKHFTTSEGDDDHTRGYPPSAGTLTHIQTAEHERYATSEEIARGGMGAVLRALDCKIRREVAVKYLLDQSDEGKKARFIAEAQITGQLQHPNIVPVHDLGIDSRQRVFFAMKMVKGRSLAEILEALRKQPAAAEKEWPLNRLLTGFIGVCNALAYAHARGVIHRDVKPANIMLGEFGEVYLMDWGLAKVLDDLRQEGPSPAPTSNGSSLEAPLSMGHNLDFDLTRDGSVVGTPMYMSPEQAQGKIFEVNVRTDIYSLGAILYEMLVLRPILEKTDDDLVMLTRAIEGKIVAPEVRCPARAGKIPAELSAIAMKALARNPGDRYESVAALQHDIELYREGRSVSAKDDSLREMFWKLVKRNRGVSAAVSVFSIVLAGIVLVGVIAINLARIRAEKAIDEYRAEHQARTEQAVNSVPAYLRAAKFAINNRSYEDALVQANTSLAYNPVHGEAHYLKALAFTGLMRFSEAAVEFDYCAPGQSDDRMARLAALCRKAQSDRPSVLIAMADILRTMNAYPIDDDLYRAVETYIHSKQDLFDLYRKRIEAAWPGPGKQVTINKNGLIQLDFQDRRDLHDLAPLRDMKISILSIHNSNRVRDLSPLKETKLVALDLSGCQSVDDLSPLRGMQLHSLDLSSCNDVHDLSPLEKMPLRSFTMKSSNRIEDLSALKGLPLAMLDLSYCQKVHDLAPLRDMPLNSLNLGSCQLLRDLSPLRGKKLSSLDISFCPNIQDLTPLEGMPLARLNLRACDKVSSLASLKGMPKLVSLNLGQCRQIQDLSPLAGLPLTLLTIDECPVRDIAALQGMPLKGLSMHGCEQVQDFSPLRGMPLRQIFLPSRKVTPEQAEVLRGIKTLESIRVDYAEKGQMPVVEFWERYESGEFGMK